MKLVLPDLPFAYDALKPYFSQETFEYHHDKHHKAYVDTANKLLEGNSLDGQPLETIVKSAYGKNTALFNNAAQHYNHSEYWHSLKPKGGGAIPGTLEKALIESFGSVAKAKEDLIQAGVGQFGSGWAWLALKDGKIVVMATANAENPLVHGATPILTVDLWEHTYYIDYRNRRRDYLEAFVEHMVNWEYAEQRCLAAMKQAA
ncbi:superoxide dismutase [Methylovirgula sp. HY1]|uniref:superoxide dismutase n=1 Tax=Methylovirgula sp. HY1 TaxID=2822761 RepID=UPI001C5A9DD9|nr:superoxide dismutase [Methylovirgula sp. HY1]QXX73491.1 Superoxide dismutase [Mn] [Methylovirgula sp. HY1]